MRKNSSFFTPIGGFAKVVLAEHIATGEKVPFHYFNDFCQKTIDKPYRLNRENSISENFQRSYEVHLKS